LIKQVIICDTCGALGSEREKVTRLSFTTGRYTDAAGDRENAEYDVDLCGKCALKILKDTASALHNQTKAVPLTIDSFIDLINAHKTKESV